MEDYSTHVPGDVVNLIRQDDMKYRKRVLTSASGTTTVKILPKVFEKHQLWVHNYYIAWQRKTSTQKRLTLLCYMHGIFAGIVMRLRNTGVGVGHTKR